MPRKPAAKSVERLHTARSLAGYLEAQRGKRITIVTAFASATDTLLEKLTQHNDVELIVGTINAYSDPRFIEAAAKLPRCRLSVDFRGSDSVHWKLYLVAPSTVIVGSSNFTATGIGMARDTCVVIESPALYRDYERQVRSLRLADGVLFSEDRRFKPRLAAYKELNARIQAAQQGARAAQQATPTVADWLANGDTTLRFFIWTEEVAKVDQAAAARVVSEQAAAAGTAPSSRGRRPYRELLALDMEGRRPPFAPGDIVLCASARGGWIKFVSVDLVWRNRVRKKHYFIELRKSRYPELFQLTPDVKQAIKSLVVQRVADDREDELELPVTELRAALGF